MATEKPLFTMSFIAGEDLSAKQYRFVTLDASGLAIMPTAITDKCVGILQNNPVAGELALVMDDGVSKLSADAAIAALALIGTSTDGQGQTAVNTNFVYAYALEACSNANEIISVRVFPGSCVIHA